MKEHIGITGTREGGTELQLRTLRDYLYNRRRISLDEVIFHHGCCVGVDKEGHNIAKDLELDVIGHPPVLTYLMMDINESEFTELRTPKPFLVRNQEIVNSVTTLLVVPNSSMPPYGQKHSGTWYTYRYAKSRNIDRIIIWPDGTASHEFIVRS